MLSQATREALSRRKLSVNAAHLRFGISRETLTRMLAGHQPTLEKVEQFARAMKLDVNEWRELAGYERIDPTPARHLIDGPEGGEAGGAQGLSSWERFWIRFGELTDACTPLGIPVPMPNFAGGSREAIGTEEQAGQALRDLVAGVLRDYPEHAGVLQRFMGEE